MRVAALLLAFTVTASVARADDGRMRQRCAGGLLMATGAAAVAGSALAIKDDGFELGSGLALGLGSAALVTGAALHVATRGDLDDREFFVRRRCRARVAMGLGVPLLATAIFAAVGLSKARGMEGIPWAFAMLLSGAMGIVMTLAGMIVRLRTDAPMEMVVSPLSLRF